MDPETREILERAKALVEKKSRWTQNVLARNEKGWNTGDAKSKDAIAWSANGAVDYIDGLFAEQHGIIIKPGSVTTDFGSRAHSALAQAVQALFPERTFRTMLGNRDIDMPFTRLWHVNDHLGHREVLMVFDYALAAS